MDTIYKIPILRRRIFGIFCTLVKGDETESDLILITPLLLCED
jgi:hypothetical protein